ncbi:ninjurin-1-like isoform X3 [Rhopalosiphum maidis]|uniref:ninjurin-1-like isoform X3 n=1 Tax=Rhopalosiphum maidis TaxID=43146 RepID=UPI000EFFA268|nr:ninjurin-1-like isoform X3 [Rhopalosiphum maidis]
MDNSILEQRRMLENKKRQEKTASEQTDSSNFTKIQNNINGLSDPSHVELGNTSTQIVQPTEDNELQPIIKNKNGIFENILADSDDDTLKAFDLYRKKKLLTQSMMDIALFSANANQLRHVLETFDGQYISYICVILLSMSIILQILVGMTMLLSIQYNVTNCNDRKMAFKFGNYVIVGIFLITVVNILISAFGKPA